MDSLNWTKHLNSGSNSTSLYSEISTVKVSCRRACVASEQQAQNAVFSQPQTVEYLVLSKYLPVENLAGEASFISPVTRQVHVVLFW